MLALLYTGIPKVVMLHATMCTTGALLRKRINALTTRPLQLLLSNEFKIRVRLQASKTDA
eukprot:359442-Chlamydomonas_euryale.AAC.2